jgi:hypothetical protein
VDGRKRGRPVARAAQPGLPAGWQRRKRRKRRDGAAALRGVRAQRRQQQHRRGTSGRICWPSPPPPADCARGRRTRPRPTLRARLSQQTGSWASTMRSARTRHSKLARWWRSTGPTAPQSSVRKQPRPVARPPGACGPRRSSRPRDGRRAPAPPVALRSGTPENRADDWRASCARMHMLRDGKWHAIVRVRVRVRAHLHVPHGGAR